jgi:hypothetical protein
LKLDHGEIVRDMACFIDPPSGGLGSVKTSCKEKSVQPLHILMMACQNMLPHFIFLLK